MHPLKRYLRSKGWSVREFIERNRLEFSASYIQGVMDGYGNLTKASAAKLSEVTGISKEVLMFPEDYSNFTPKT